MSATRVPGPDLALFTPSTQRAKHRSHSHVVQFYSRDSSLLDELSGFIGTALGAENGAIIIASKHHRKGLERRLATSGLNVPGLIEQGRYISLDAAGTLSQFLVEDYPDAELFRTLMGEVIARARTVAGGKDRSVVAFGEMVALLWADGKSEAAIRLEQLWNDLGETHTFSLRCAYPIAGFQQEEHGEPFLRICTAHSDVIPADSFTDLATAQERYRSIARLQQKEQVYETLTRTKRELEDQITDNIEAERKLRESERSLRELAGQLLRMQDEERRHVGRELHDSVGQYLASLKMNLELMKSELESTKASRQLADCLRLVDQSITEVRTMSYLLYPPMLEEMGLETAILWYLNGFAKRSGIQTSSEISNTLGRLPRDIELAIFRVIQESLTNVLRHSGSPTAHIRLSVDVATVRVEVKDQGKGIPAATLKSTNGAIGRLGVGLRGMNERMRQLEGKLEVLSNELGTTVVGSAPCGGPGSEVGG